MKHQSPIHRIFHDLLISITKRTDEENLKLFTEFHEANGEKEDYVSIQHTCQNFIATFMFESGKKDDAIVLLYDLLNSATGNSAQASGTSFTLAKYLYLTKRKKESVEIIHTILQKYRIEWTGTLYLLKILAEEDKESLNEYKELISEIEQKMGTQLPDGISPFEAVLELDRIFRKKSRRL